MFMWSLLLRFLSLLVKYTIYVIFEAIKQLFEHQLFKTPWKRNWLVYLNIYFKKDSKLYLYYFNST